MHFNFSASKLLVFHVLNKCSMGFFPVSLFVSNIFKKEITSLKQTN